jgi:ribosomal protein L11 methyltransferase
VSYLQLRFQLERDRADDLNQVLDELGALSVTWENAGEDAYFEVAYPREPDWRHVCLTGLFDASREPGTIVAEINARLGEQLIPQVKTLENQDWERAWMSRFEPRRYGDDLWICPSWSEPPDPGAVNIMIDPGLAFGTGDHPTTALCLNWIAEREWPGQSVVDYGCGSGVLAIGCLLKGADRAIGVDVDPRALSASTLNAARNGVDDRYEAVAPGELPADLQADVVIANILSNVLIELSDVLTHATRPGGHLLLTGILEGHADKVRAVFAPAFDIETRSRDGWCLLVARKT